MEIMKPNKFMAVGLAVVLLTGLFVWSAAAQQGRNGRFNPGIAMGEPGMFNLRGLVGNLNLSADQKSQIKSILTAHRQDILNATKAVLQVRADLESAVTNNNDIQGAASRFAGAQVTALQLRQQIFNEIKSKNILTADQLATIQQFRQAREQRLQNRLNRIDKRTGN
jgi:Spy/CpxP family protein refolding chaperone